MKNISNDLKRKIMEIKFIEALPSKGDYDWGLFKAGQKKVKVKITGTLLRGIWNITSQQRTKTILEKLGGLKIQLEIAKNNRLKETYSFGSDNFRDENGHPLSLEEAIENLEQKVTKTKEKQN